MQHGHVAAGVAGVKDRLGAKPFRPVRARPKTATKMRTRRGRRGGLYSNVPRTLGQAAIALHGAWQWSAGPWLAFAVEGGGQGEQLVARHTGGLRTPLQCLQLRRQLCHLLLLGLQQSGGRPTTGDGGGAVKVGMGWCWDGTSTFSSFESFVSPLPTSILMNAWHRGLEFEVGVLQKYFGDASPPRSDEDSRENHPQEHQQPQGQG